MSFAAISDALYLCVKGWRRRIAGVGEGWSFSDWYLARSCLVVEGGIDNE